MGQEVKNLLRAQSKYGLMGSSAKTGKNFFDGSQEQFLDKTVIWDRTPPPPICQMQCICVGESSRVPNLQTEFNYLNSFKSYGIFSDFVVPVVPASSPHRPCRPHVVPVSSPSSPHRPHSPQKVPMWSPWSVVSVVPTHVVPTLVVPTHVVPVVPTSSPSSPRRLEGPQIIPNPPDSHPTHPPPPWGVGGPESLKIQ